MRGELTRRRGRGHEIRDGPAGRSQLFARNKNDGPAGRSQLFARNKNR